MRIVFFGTPKFAADILEKLIASQHEIVAVYTKPDSVRKRGRNLVPCETKEVALAHSLPVMTPVNLREQDTTDELRDLDADVFCVAAYGCLFPKDVLAIPRWGCINVHASLLPRWRGAAPIERAILAGDDTQGVSIMKMNEGMDTGDYCLQNSVEAEGKSSVQLRDELAVLGAEALLETLDRLEDGMVEWQTQDESLVTLAPKIEKAETLLYPSDAAAENIRRVLASSDSAPAKCAIDSRVCRILEAGISTEDVAPSKVAYRGRELILGCKEGSMCIKTLKPDGKKAMNAASFVAGSKNVRDNTALWQAV